MFTPPKGDGRLRHLPFFLSAFGEGRLIPDLSAVPLRRQFPAIIAPAQGATKMRVGFFTGCFIDFVDPEIGRSLIRVLGRHGVEVIFPKEQTCCGIPVFMSGDLEDGLDLLRANLEAFAPYKLEAIVVACATCGTALKESYKILVSGLSQEWIDRVNVFSGQVMDISEFLTQKIELNKPEAKILEKVTYHDPCHLNRSQGITAQPRQVLKNLSGIKLVEMHEPQRCCGGGGSFSFYNYELSKQISQKKIKDIEATQATTVVTGCPGCMLQLKDQLTQKGLPIKVKHLIQVVDETGA
jgi:glycolate oxidase iron-sulfur subunit